MYKGKETPDSLYIYHERCYTSPKPWISAVDLNLGIDIHGQIWAVDKKNSYNLWKISYKVTRLKIGKLEI